MCKDLSSWSTPRLRLKTCECNIKCEKTAHSQILRFIHLLKLRVVRANRVVQLCFRRRNRIRKFWSVDVLCATKTLCKIQTRSNLRCIPSMLLRSQVQIPILCSSNLIQAAVPTKCQWTHVVNLTSERGNRGKWQRWSVRSSGEPEQSNKYYLGKCKCLYQNVTSLIPIKRNKPQTYF